MSSLYKRKKKTSKEIEIEYIKEILNKTFIYSNKDIDHYNIQTEFDINIGNIIVIINNLDDFIFNNSEYEKTGLSKNINIIYKENGKIGDRLYKNITINISGVLEGYTFYTTQSSFINKDKSINKPKQFILRSYLDLNNNNEINFKNCNFFGNIGFAFTDSPVNIDSYKYFDPTNIIFPFNLSSIIKDDEKFKFEVEGKKDFNKIFNNCNFDGLNQKIHYNTVELWSFIYKILDYDNDSYSINKEKINVYKSSIINSINKYLRNKKELKLEIVY